MLEPGCIIVGRALVPACPFTRVRLYFPQNWLAERLVARYRTSPARSCSSLERQRALGAPAQTGYQRLALPLLVLHLLLSTTLRFCNCLICLFWSDLQRWSLVVCLGLLWYVVICRH